MKPQALDDERQLRRIAILPTAGLFVAMLGGAWPSEWPSPLTLIYLTLAAACIAFLFRLAIIWRQPLLGVLLLLSAAAYAPGLGDGLANGVSNNALYGLSAGVEDVEAAVGILMVFLLTLSLGTQASRRIWRGLLPVPKPESPAWTQSLWVGLTIVLVTSFVVAVTVGTWSSYGARSSSEIRDGSMRLEFFYEPALFTAFGLAVRTLIDEYEKVGKRRTRWWWFVSIVLFFLLFTKQIRRMMIASIVYGLMEVLGRRHLANRILANPSRAVVLAAMLGSLMAGVIVGSNTWRQSSNDLATNSITERLGDMATRAPSASEESQALRRVRERLTYLWLDSATVRLAPQFAGVLPLEDQFLRALSINTPGMLFRQKYLYPLVTCETAFLMIGIEADLPCTAHAEGYIAAGVPGVVAVALAWAVVIGFATVLIERRRTLGLIAALHLLLPHTALENSSFYPGVYAARLALLGCAAIGGIAVVFAMLFAGQLRVVSQNQQTARHTKVPVNAGR